MNCHLEAISLCCVRQYKTLFANLSFHLRRNEILLVEGPNGSGKSSLLRLLTGLTTPANGEILWRGKPIQGLRSSYTNDLHYISHANGIKLGLTVIENLELARVLLCEPFTSQPESILTLLQLDQYQNTQAGLLSAGQKRRLALARLFLFPKPLWILDEPLTALDKEVQTWFLTQLENHAHQGGIAIVSSHHALSFREINTRTLRLDAC